MIDRLRNAWFRRVSAVRVANKANIAGKPASQPLTDSLTHSLPPCASITCPLVEILSLDGWLDCTFISAGPYSMSTSRVCCFFTETASLRGGSGRYDRFTEHIACQECLEKTSLDYFDATAFLFSCVLISSTFPLRF